MASVAPLMVAESAQASSPHVPTANSHRMAYRLATWLMDYCWVFMWLYTADSVYRRGADEAAPFKFTILAHVTHMALFAVITDVRDIIYMVAFPSTVIPAVKARGHPKAPLLEILRMTVKTVATVTGVLWSLDVTGLGYWTPIVVGSFWETLFNVQSLVLEAYAVWIIKDIVSMGILHPWMHRPANYWMHKTHHVSFTKNMSAVYGYDFDTLDLLLENSSGLLFWLPLRYFLLGTARVHLGVFIVVVWLDSSCHSANPYTATLLNPLLDYWLRPVVAHSLHHALINSHYTLVPWHAFLGRGQDDVEHYNRLFDTDVD